MKKEIERDNKNEENTGLKIRNVVLKDKICVEKVELTDKDKLKKQFRQYIIKKEKIVNGVFYPIRISISPLSFFYKWPLIYLVI